MRLGSDARRTVVFFGFKQPEGDISYGGTGFLVAVPVDDQIAAHYIVTCRHVATHLDCDFVIRGNDRSGKAFTLDVDQLHWVYHDDPTVDVAIAPLYLTQSHWDRVYLPISVFLQGGEERQLLCGDDIAIAGLFRLHHGKDRNVPIVHCGTVAAIADATEKIPVEDRDSKKILLVEAHLVEAQTLEGLSGSPVFIQRYAGLPNEYQNFQGRPAQVIAYADVRLFGIYTGAWDARPGSVLAKDRNLSDTHHRVPVGVGLVVPSEKIVEVIMKKFNDDLQNNKFVSADDQPAKMD